MSHIPDVIFYILTFFAVYIQVFLIVTFLEKRKNIEIRKDNITLPYYPQVSIIVPCYNEEKTVKRTVESLLALHYPQDKLQIMLIDDGSRDNTFLVLESFKNFPNIDVYKKENGGKHTAMNFGISKARGQFIGGLDADSFVHPEALNRMMTYFQKDSSAMAVCPAVIAYEPKNLIQKAQRADYNFGIFMKKVQSFIGAVYVTPGPFSIYRKEVFENIGPFRKAHNTEDQEIALRMQKNHYKIEHCPDAYVYTVTPNTVAKLYRQRVRWIYGFLKNVQDYKELLFKKKYGNIGFFALPAGIISIISVIYISLMFVYQIITFTIHKITEFKIIGFHNFFHMGNFSLFYINTSLINIVAVLLAVTLITSLLIGQNMAEGKMRPNMSIVYFYILSFTVAPFWLGKALYNVIFSRGAGNWAAERNLL